MQNTIGVHYVWDVRNIDPHRIEWVDTIRPIMERILRLTPLDIVSESYKQFDPVGVTGVYLLSESHFSIHTWPEHGYMGLDLFSCVAVDYDLISQEIKALWQSDDVNLRIIKRGVLQDSAREDISQDLESSIK